MVGKMSASAEANFLTVTELADTLVRATTMDFRTAHEIVSHAVKELDGEYDLEQMASAVERALAAHVPPFHVDAHVLRKALTAANFVAVRTIPGGPAPEALDPEIQRALDRCIEDHAWLTTRQSREKLAASTLRHECDRLLDHLPRT
jgi:argininosuccinate lyase